MLTREMGLPQGGKAATARVTQACSSMAADQSRISGFNLLKSSTFDKQFAKVVHSRTVF